MGEDKRRKKKELAALDEACFHLRLDHQRLHRPEIKERGGNSYVRRRRLLQVISSARKR